MDRGHAARVGRGLWWWRPLASTAAVVALTGAVIYASHRDADEAIHPQRAGQPLDAYEIAGHLVAARADALIGNARGAQKHVNAIAHDVMRSARVPDVSRRIDHEAARAAVRPLDGVRSAIWLDRDNLVVMVDGLQYRSMTMIDRVCGALDPLGDTLAVVVNLQDVTARDADAAMTLSRNCQLSEGELAMFQRKRNLDVVTPELRRTFKSQQ